MSNRPLHLSKEELEKHEQNKKMRMDNNRKVTQLDKALKNVVLNFAEDYKEFFKKKELEVAEVIERFGSLDDLEDGIPQKKDRSLELSYYISKPIIPKTASVPKAYTANSLLYANEFYWEKIVIPANQKMLYIPMLQDLLRMMNISTSAFYSYSVDGDEAMRDACQIIYDQFISYYQRNGMQKNISEIMSIFVLKTSFHQRENDVPQVVNNIVNTAPSEKIDKFAQQYGFEKFED